VASFEKLKEMFGGRKIITLSENGSVPYPDDMKADGAGWSYFMPWYGDYTMDGWAHDNTAADWKKIMKNDYVITLDKMPGWANYTVAARAMPQCRHGAGVTFRMNGGFLELAISHAIPGPVELYTIKGSRIAAFGGKTLPAGRHRIGLRNVGNGLYAIKFGPRQPGSVIVKE
jgi:mannan endo-1,4-beta-mannosidase